MFFIHFTRINLDIDAKAAAAIVALRPSIEHLIVKASENPESFFPLRDLDQKLVNIIVELCRMEGDFPSLPPGVGQGPAADESQDWNNEDETYEGGDDQGDDDDYGDDEVGGDYSSEGRGTAMKRSHDDTDSADGAGPAKVARTSIEGNGNERGKGRGGFRGGNTWGNRGGGFQNRGGFRGGSGGGGYGGGGSSGFRGRGGGGYGSGGGSSYGGGSREGGRFQRGGGRGRGGWTPRGGGGGPSRRPSRGGYGSNYPF